MNTKHKDALMLMDELSKTLEGITGSNGRNSFNSEDMCVSGSVFVVAYDDEGEAVGCGALRPIKEGVAELKRMYAKNKLNGTGSFILSYLERWALNYGYRGIWLETRMVNTSAVMFYERRGYKRIPNYGKYEGREEAVCFSKLLR